MNTLACRRRNGTGQIDETQDANPLLAVELVIVCGLALAMDRKVSGLVRMKT